MCSTGSHFTAWHVPAGPSSATKRSCLERRVQERRGGSLASAGVAHSHHRCSQQGCGRDRGEGCPLRESVALTQIPGSVATWLSATPYKWVSFSPKVSPSFTGEGPLSWPVPPSRCRCCLGCGRLGSGVMSCRRRCGEKKKRGGVVGERGKDVSLRLYLLGLHRARNTGAARYHVSK